MSEVLLSQLAHVELVSPKPEETVEWMVDVLGLEETAREGQSVYLRGWAEWLHSSLIVTEGPDPRSRHIAWRTYGPDDPEVVARTVDGDLPSAGSTAPSATARRSATALPHGQHLHEVFWETELYRRHPRRREPDFAVPPAEVLHPRRRRALHRPRHDRHAGHPRRHRVLQDARAAPHRSDRPCRPGFTVFSR